MSNTVAEPKPAPTKYDFSADLDYFIANQDELVNQYDGKILIIRNQRIEGACDSALQACMAGDKRFGKGNFSIRRCIAGPRAYTVYCRSRDLTGAA